MPVAVSNTAYGIINDAMHDAGLLKSGVEPNSEQLATNLRRLCDIINMWQLDGIKLFLYEEYSVTLVAGTNTYTVNQAVGVLPNKNLRIDFGRVETPTGTKRPIDPISWEEWNRLSTDSSGAVVGFFQDRQATSLTVKVWNTPDSTEALNTLVLTIRKQALNPFNLEADISFPQEWRLALRWALADDICTGQPDTIMARCAGKAQQFKEVLEGFDVETAQTTFAPSSHYYGSRNFR